MVEIFARVVPLIETERKYVRRSIFYLYPTILSDGYAINVGHDDNFCSE